MSTLPRDNEDVTTDVHPDPHWLPLDLVDDATGDAIPITDDAWFAELDWNDLDTEGQPAIVPPPAGNTQLVTALHAIVRMVANLDSDAGRIARIAVDEAVELVRRNGCVDWREYLEATMEEAHSLRMDGWDRGYDRGVEHSAGVSSHHLISA